MENKKLSCNILWIAGPNSKFKLSGAKPAGFWVGLWHGYIAAFIFFIQLCIGTKKIRMYETNNNGSWYDFGFLIGVGAISLFGIKITGSRLYLPGRMIF